MKKQVKNALYICLSVGILALLPLLIYKSQPVQVALPDIDLQEIAQQKELQHKAAQAAAARETLRRVFDCATDEDCIIVDKDPCGCLIGPEGVTAINAAETLTFNKIHSNTLAKACPEIPSTVLECSPSAQAVCRNNRCKIEY